MRSRSRPVAASRWADSSAISSPRRSISAAQPVAGSIMGLMLTRKSLFIGDSFIRLRQLYTAIFEGSRRRQDGRSPAALDFFRLTPVPARVDRAERGGGAFARCRG